MICLGINYRDHAVEASRFSEDAFGGERPYTIYFSKRVNAANATGGIIPAYEGLVEGLDYEEISGLTGEREGTLRTQFSRGKAKLVEKLRRVRQ